jgi:hypothetical protein
MKTNKTLDAYEAVLHDAALAKAENSKSTPSQRRIAMRVKGRVQADLADMRRSHLPAADPPAKLRPISSWLFGLDREGLSAKLEDLTARMGGALQYAYRDLSGLSDDDLRRLIDLLVKDNKPTE